MFTRDCHDLPEHLADLHLFAERARGNDVSERKNMHVPALILGQLQDPRDAVKHGRRYLTAASLLQVRVPGGAEPGENRDFLPPKPRGPAAARRWQADIVWPEPLPPRSQERGEFLVLPPARHGSVLHLVPVRSLGSGTPRAATQGSVRSSRNGTACLLWLPAQQGVQRDGEVPSGAGFASVEAPGKGDRVGFAPAEHQDVNQR